jgi:hypothetical protein
MLARTVPIFLEAKSLCTKEIFRFVRNRRQTRIAGSAKVPGQPDFLGFPVKFPVLRELRTAKIPRIMETFIASAEHLMVASADEINSVFLKAILG